MTAPTIGVCGYGRCGSTMLMTMLTAGGVPAVEGSQAGSFEVADLDAVMALDQSALAGRCVKLLDVVSLNGGQAPPAPEWRFVWLDRNPFEQARSATKFAIAFGIIEPFEHRHEMVRHLSELVDSYRADRARRLGQLRELGPVTVLGYEQVLANPGRAARYLAKLAPDLDRRAATAVVHRRTGECRPDLSVELALSIDPDEDDPTLRVMASEYAITEGARTAREAR